MGVLDHLMGNVSEVEPDEIRGEIEPLLTKEEEIETAFAIMRDMLIFTNLRLIWVDKQGVTGKKVKFDSIPYRSVHRFSIENAGTFDAESELIIWAKGHAQPLSFQLSRKIDTGKVGRTLARNIV